MAAPANPAGTVKQGEFAVKSARQLPGKIARKNCEDKAAVFVALFQIRRQHTFDPFHEGADPAR
jgi:putative heme iron utilization protein